MHSDTYFANKLYGTKYTVKVCNPRTKPFTAEEFARQAKFNAAHDALLALTPEQKAVYRTAFEAQKKYKTLNGYILASCEAVINRRQPPRILLAGLTAGSGTAS